MKRGSIPLLLLLILSLPLAAQELTIESCYEQARNNYPLIKTKALIEQSKEYSIANIRSGFLPQVSLNAQATYQSAVTQVPISVPGFEVETLSKDQYKIYGEVNQTIYDGGTLKSQKRLTETSSRIEDQKLEVELYQIRERINQLFFGILLVEEQTDQVKLLQKDLQRNISHTESAIRNGTAFKTNLDILHAEYLKAEQRVIEMNAARHAYLSMLGLFINQSLPESTTLVKPQALVIPNEPEIVRPELTLLNYQNDLYKSQYQLGKTKNSPRVGLFLQAGYGRPALNLLLNDFDTYYIGGVRLNWTLGGLYNSKRDKELFSLNTQKIEVQRQNFLFNTSLATNQQQQELDKLRKLIDVDDQIIALRERIAKTAEVQQENGVITTNDYLRELNAEDQAKQNKLLHEMQLLMSMYAYQNTIGNQN
ncbi:MAG: TolC family protein [Cyclobacteriaceae bacterium]|nr:TolC family protein [Cyclobacteriaceae bacterium]